MNERRWGKSFNYLKGKGKPGFSRRNDRTMVVGPENAGIARNSLVVPLKTSTAATCQVVVPSCSSVAADAFAF